MENWTLNTQLFRQNWSLDSTGNWSEFKEDADGNGTWDLDQQRAANAVNEITDITETTGPVWVTPAYDRAGNITTIPKTVDPTVALAATYDAWNMLVKINEGATTIADYQYDGAKRRIVKSTFSGGELSEKRHSYYSEPSKWQVLEERLNGLSSANRQFVWGLRYVDELILRERDYAGNGVLDERYYGLQDANWNLTTVAVKLGSIEERHAYHAYGMSIVLDSLFSYRGSSNLDWETRFAGYRFDKESQWQCVRNRIFVPLLGRWAQRDPAGVPSGLNFYFPIGYQSGVNLYEYVNSLPNSDTDPTGMIPQFLAGCIVGAGISIFSSIVFGKGFDEAVCRAVLSCIVSSVAATLLTALPSLANCMVGATTAVVNTLAAALCANLCGEKKWESDFLGCLLYGAVINSLVGCAIGAKGASVGPEAAPPELVSGLKTAVLAIIGIDIAEFCEILSS